MIEPGIYRRAFDWRLSNATKESLPGAAAAFVTLSTDDYLDIFEDYLTINRKRIKNRTAIAKAQLHLVEELLIAQSAVKRYRESLNELKNVAPDSQSVEESLKRDIKLVERELFLHRAHANCIRAIGDGLAWRALSFDRAALRALAGKAVKQQLLDQGVINELHQWSFLFDTGQGLAIFNALTNWLAIGDITIVRNDGQLEILEVKSSETGSNRVSRQKQKMKEVSDLLKTGRGTLEDQEISIIRFDVHPETDLPSLFGLLDEAGRTGFAGSFVNDFCYIEALDFRAIRDSEKVWKAIAAQTQKDTAVWAEKNDFVVRMDSIDILSFTPNCAPFSVFPFPERMCVELLTGAKNYTCFLNLSEVGREFERRGWQVEKGPQDYAREGGAADSPVFRLHKDKMHPEIPPADLMRIQMETLRPAVIIQTLEQMRELGPGKFASSSLVVYSGEKDIWL